MTKAMFAVGIAAALVAAPSHAPAERPARVEIKDFMYGPREITVPAGTPVTWTNHDEEPHTITSATGAFGSTGLSHDETFTQTFPQPGTYAYFCALHPQMRATVVVR
jgi:plastocyanin